jgi:hypothetical protein
MMMQFSHSNFIVVAPCTVRTHRHENSGSCFLVLLLCR